MRVSSTAAEMIRVARELSDAVSKLQFAPPVEWVYNPLDYARAPFEEYLQRYASGPKRVVLMGMNPGPFGMAQTGIPFGDVHTVASYLGIEAGVDRPEKEHPKRRVLGLECPRVEVSGRRLWSWVEETFGPPDDFFSDFLVINYCPLVFLEAGGRNRTPDRLPAVERRTLLDACDDSLRETVNVLQPQWLIGVGRFARIRAEAALEATVSRPKIAQILHPSPASPAANRGWRAAVEEQFSEIGLDLPQ